MEISFETRILSRDAEAYTSKAEVCTKLISSSKTENGFNVKNVRKGLWEVDKGVINVDIFNHFGVNPEDISFLHVQFTDKALAYISRNDVRFTLSINSAVVGKMNQFTLLNVQDMDFNSINVNVDNSAVPDTDRLFNLSITIGLK